MPTPPKFQWIEIFPEMDPCDVKSEFISLFLFENGVPCQPERLRVRRTEIDKYFQKNGKTYCYQGKTWVLCPIIAPLNNWTWLCTSSIYSCCGESVCKFSSDLPENAAFVLVPWVFMADVGWRQQCRHFNQLSRPQLPWEIHPSRLRDGLWKIAEEDGVQSKEAGGPATNTFGGLSVRWRRRPLRIEKV